MSQEDRLLDLLTTAATESLTPAEQQELDALLAEQDRWGRDDLDLAAAEMDIAMSDSLGEAMPEHLRRRIAKAAPSQIAAAAPPVASTQSTLSRSNVWSSAGWLAAAAMFILMLWSPWRAGDPAAPGAALPVTAPTAAELRAELVQDASDLLQVDWGASEIDGYTEVTGDVIWSHSRQEGYMRLSGLPINDPTAKQYQLWIVDPARDKNPIDGGVFDIDRSTGEVIIPIDAKLAVTNAAAFAITLEQPGGVVVSEGPLLIVAAPA